MTAEEFINTTGINHLYHFTDVENLPLIREHGLLPYNLLLGRNILPPKPGGNDLSRRADVLKGVNRYIHLCFKNQHPMEFDARKAGRIKACFLQISLDVLNFKGVKGCASVSNKGGVKIYPLEQALDKIDWEILFKTPVDFNNPEQQKRYNEAKKSEILIPAPIPPELIKNLN